MNHRLPPITVRLDPETLTRIDNIVDHCQLIHPKGGHAHATHPYTRSDLIRHAITAGLDVLTDAEPIQL